MLSFFIVTCYKIKLLPDPSLHFRYIRVLWHLASANLGELITTVYKHMISHMVHYLIHWNVYDAWIDTKRVNMKLLVNVLKLSHALNHHKLHRQNHRMVLAWFGFGSTEFQSWVMRPLSIFLNGVWTTEGRIRYSHLKMNSLKKCLNVTVNKLHL